MRSGDEDEASLRINIDGNFPSRPSHTAHVPPSPPPPISSSPPASATTISIRQHRTSSSKSNHRLLSLLLQALVMALVIILFFLFIGIAAVVLIHICIAGRALHRCRRRDRHRRSTATPFLEEHSLHFGDVGFSPKDLQKLPPPFRLTESVSSQDCAVCLEAFREGERCRILPGCNHFFHSTCIDTWLCKASACPVCRGIVELKE